MIINRSFEIAELHRRLGQPVGEALTMRGLEYRMRIMMEEMREVAIAGDQLNTAQFQKRGPEFIKKKQADFLKELVDLSYTIEGTAVALGYDFDRAFELVHASNMTKDAGASRYDKFVKGPNYKPADVTECLPKQS